MLTELRECWRPWGWNVPPTQRKGDTHFTFNYAVTSFPKLKKKKKLKIDTDQLVLASSLSFFWFPLSNKYEAINDQRSLSKTDTTYLVPVFWKSKNQKETSIRCGREVI